MGEVIQLHEHVAECPKCKGQLWYIHVDKRGDEFENITAHECSTCDFRVELKIQLIKEEPNAESNR